jgi:protein-S-isoprenylcysteine O-methyltransferase Ste14
VAFEKGSMLLIGASVGGELPLPLLLDILGIGVVPISLVEVLVALIVMMSGLGLRIWAALSLGKYYSVTLKVVADQTVTMNGPYAWSGTPVI